MNELAGNYWRWWHTFLGFVSFVVFENWCTITTWSGAFLVSREIFGLRISFVIHNQTLIIMDGSPVVRTQWNTKVISGNRKLPNLILSSIFFPSSKAFPSGSREGNDNFSPLFTQVFLRFLKSFNIFFCVPQPPRMKIIVVEFIIKPFSVPYVRSQLLPDVYQFPFLAASRKVSIFKAVRERQLRRRRKEEPSTLAQFHCH